MQREKPSESSSREDFLRGADQRGPWLLVELIDFLKYNKKWWLAPLLILLLVSAGLLILGSLPGASILYTFF